MAILSTIESYVSREHFPSIIVATMMFALLLSIVDALTLGGDAGARTALLVCMLFAVFSGCQAIWVSSLIPARRVEVARNAIACIIAGAIFLIRLAI